MWTFVFGLAVVLVGGNAMGCNGPLTLQAQSLLKQGKAAYQRKDYPATIEKMNSFLDQAGRSRKADEGYYLRGLAGLKLGDRDGAKRDFTEAIERTDSKHIKAHSLNALGDIAWDAGDMDTAARSYSGALKHVRADQKPADHSHYRLGCVLQRQGKWSEADLQFSKLDFYFRGGELALRAARRVNCRAWSVQAGAFNNRDRAKTLAQDLSRTALPAEVRPALKVSKVNYVVQVGRYQTYPEVTRALGTVRQQVSDAFIITVR